MASPTMTIGTQAGFIASQSLAANTALAAVTLDLTTKFEGQLQVKNGFPNVAPTTVTGVTCTVTRLFGGGPTADTQAMTSFTVGSTQNVTTYGSISLPTGKYSIVLKNTDTTSAVTVESTLSTVDTIA